MTTDGATPTTGTEVAPPEQVINPVTAQVVTVDSPTGDLGVFIDDARECKRILDEQIRWASREILRRQDKQASWTDHLPGVKVTGQSPKQNEDWDGAGLRAALMRFVDEGTLAIAAVDAAVEQNISWKVKKAGVGKLRKIGGEVAATVDRLCVTSEPERRVSVSRVA
jgi:hypothetical protein